MQQRLLLQAVHEERRAVARSRSSRISSPTAPAARAGPRRAGSASRANARNLDDARIGQELREIAPHRRRRRRVGRAEVDEQDADPRGRSCFQRLGSRRHGPRAAHWRCRCAAKRRARDGPAALTSRSARQSASAFAACARIARLHRRQPAEQHALRAQRLRAASARGRTGRRAATIRPSRNANVASMRFSTRRPVAEYVYVATQCARPVGVVGLDVRRDDARDPCRARTASATSRPTPAASRSRNTGIGERRVGRVAGDHRRRVAAAERVVEALDQHRVRMARGAAIGLGAASV